MGQQALWFSEGRGVRAEVIYFARVNTLRATVLESRETSYTSVITPTRQTKAVHTQPTATRPYTVLLLGIASP